VTQFSDFALRTEIQAALAKLDYHTPTPIQRQAIPPALEGRDILGIAQTGTGKTAAFTLPILQRLSTSGSGVPTPHAFRTLILTPTRELAIQIGDSIRDYGQGLRIRHAVIFGGVGQEPQVRALAGGLDIVIATPGRLLDLMDQGHVRLEKVEILVLDEADRMLDMGFIQPIRKIVKKLPQVRQNLFFSATMPPDVSDLAGGMLREPVRVEVTPVATTAERIDQRVVFAPTAEKRQVLVDLLRADTGMDRVIAFTRTKHGANRVAQYLETGGISAAAIHGNKSQSARQAALEGFRAGKVRVLVATDIAARGIDVDGVSHVVNVDLPNEPESYVHRIGRTARAGADGIAISICGEGEERVFLKDIEKLIRMKVPSMERPAATAPVRNAAGQVPEPVRGPLPTRGGRQGQGRGEGRGESRGGRGNGQPQGQQSRPAKQGAAKPAQPGAGRPQQGQPQQAKPQQSQQARPQQGRPQQGAQAGQARPNGNAPAGQRNPSQGRDVSQARKDAARPTGQQQRPAQPARQGSGHFADLVNAINSAEGRPRRPGNR